MSSQTRQSPITDGAVLTLSDWKAKNREVLLLTCNSLNIVATAPSATLAQRLYDFYHPDTDESDGSVGSDSPVKKKNSDHEDDPEEDPFREGLVLDQHGSKEQVDPGETDDVNVDGVDHGTLKNNDDINKRHNTDEEEARRREQINLATSAYEAAQQNTTLIQDIYDKIGLLNVGKDLTLAELRALRSELKNKNAKRGICFG